MVWNQRGKRGVHSGRTLRRNIDNFRWEVKNRGISKKGLIVKYQKNTGQFPHSSKTSLLEDRYGLADGLTLGLIERDVIEFSLGKRKRWQLPELVQERMTIDESLDIEEELEGEEKEQEVDVCFVERHMHPEFGRSRGDCLSVYSDKDGKVLTPKKHKYSYQTDIRKLGKDNRPSEICYEICRPPSPTSWPNMKEDQFYEKYDWMGLKSKGQKNKGYRWGEYRPKDLKDLSCSISGELLIEMPKRGKTTESKMKTVTRKQYSNVVKKMNSNGKASSSIRFPLGQYVDTLLKKSSSPKTLKSENSCQIPVSPVKKYGKGCVVLIDSQLCTKPTSKPIESLRYIDPLTSSLEEPKPQVKVDVALQDLDVSKLRSEWGNLYYEGGVIPRKFTLNISSLLPRSNLNIGFNVLFEVDNKMLKGQTSASTIVSIVPFSLCSENTCFKTATQDFVAQFAYGKRSSTLKIKEIVDVALEVFAFCSFGAEKPKKQTGSYKTIVRSLNLLNELCGWRSESFTLDGAKQKLKEEYQEEMTACDNKEAMLESQWMLPSVECGICFETFEGDDNVLTTIKECGHAFCNDCWKSHLKTQIKEGTCCIRCPGHSCDSKVDDVTIMAVVPEWYETFLNIKLNKQLESSPNWKWCPTSGCKRVVKATAPDIDSMTVLCDCGTVWCFKCKQQSHWPASCKEAKTFDKKGVNFEELLLQEKKELIKSVMVKKCPQCNYPIEKYHGCQFMMCILCSTHFCWNCSTPATYGHTCESDPTTNITEVELPFKSRRHQFEKLLQIVALNIQARSPKQLSAKKEKAIAFETSVSSYKAVSTMIPNKAFMDSNISRFMEYIVENGISETVREAVKFEFQAHLVLEGFAKKASLSRSQYTSGLHTMSQLGFIVDEVENLSQEPFSLCRDGRIQRLEKLLAIGKNCILTLKKCCKNN